MTFPLLHEREFRAFLLLRYLFAFTGSAFATVVGFQTYVLTGDPLALGCLGLVEAIPALSLMLFGGHFADRLDRRSIIVVTSIVATLCAATLAVCRPIGAVELRAILAVDLHRPGSPAASSGRRSPPSRPRSSRASTPSRASRTSSSVSAARRRSSARPWAASPSRSSGSPATYGADRAPRPLDGAASPSSAQADARADRGRVARREPARRLALRAPHAGPARLDGARPVRGLLRGRDGAAARLRDRHPACRAGRPGRPADCAIDRGTARDAHRDPPPAVPARRRGPSWSASRASA